MSLTPTKDYSDFGIDLPSGSGTERYTTCPQCSKDRKRGSQKKPCLSVNVDKQVWRCHHCGWAGSLSQGAHRGNPAWQAPTYFPPTYNPSQGLSEQALQWFTKRGIPESVVRRNQITTGKTYMPQVGEFVNTIQFPFLRKGEVVNIKHRDHHKNFRMEGGAERLFYGLDDIDEGMTVVVEGEMDKLAIETSGITACISVPDGAPAADTKNYSSKFDFMESAKDLLDKVKQFVIAVDSDAPGRRLEEELLHRFGRHRCALVRWPVDCKDANDVLMKLGSEALLLLIVNAEPPPIEGVVRVNDLHDSIDRLYHEGMPPGLNPGWPDLYPFYRISQGEFTVVTGIPGHGKSEFLDGLMVNMANNHDWVFGIFSPENHPIELHIAKLIEKKVGKPFAHGSHWVRMNPEEMAAAREWVNLHFHFIQPKNVDVPTLDETLELAESLVLREGIKGLVIDPWNELNHDRPSYVTETEHISRCLSKLRHFTRRQQLHTWVIAHPTKLEKNAKGDYPVPTPYDISGGANWRNKADNAISVYRPNLEESNGTVQVHVQKIRFKKNGRPGRCDFVYDTLSGRFKDSPTMQHERRLG
jgi:twinkle protein